MSEGKRRKIIGIGSPLGDDQAGWLVVDRLAGLPGLDVPLVKLDRPGTALISQFENADEIVLIDAMQADGLPGEIRHFPEGEWENCRTTLSSHGLGVIETLMLARELDCLPKRIDLYGIQIGSDSFQEQVSEAVAAAAEILAGIIAEDWHKRDIACRSA